MTQDAADAGGLADRLEAWGLRAERASDGCLRVGLAADEAPAILARLRDEPASPMRRLVDLTAIDRSEAKARFELVYWLHAPSTNERVRIHVQLPGEDPIADSVVGLWPAAGWLEREVFELFGVHFRGHPDLRRILLDDAFEGAPLRRDAPSRVKTGPRWGGLGS